ncbi:50S ribosomal protein Mrp49 [Polyplosphaeria fusca]|uniref:50S ribosomal protein Mrp49 n=1 Tax=Polyplosphaeria fusca TaxID=682080 RepID=A0A9P4QRU0_9PLEO|nr:50S ribosomal protein Mrp49 [Polyplosphaeria fusca]
MVNIVSRMRRLRGKLLWIRVGPGALVFPSEVSKISLQFAKRLQGGHGGARKFWREMLPRIKFRNPSIPIEVLRHTDADGPAKLDIYTTKTTSDSTAPSSSEPTHSIDVKMVNESAILQELIAKTGATVLKPTAEEEEELRDMAEFQGRSEKDRVEVRDKLMAQRREEELLRLARGEIATAS